MTTAEEIDVGLACEICGFPFKEPKSDEPYRHVSPVICWHCWDAVAPTNRRGGKRAAVSTFFDSWHGGNWKGRAG